MTEKNFITGDDFMRVSKEAYMAARDNAMHVSEENFKIRNIPKFLHADPGLEESFQRVVQLINEAQLEEDRVKELIQAIVAFQTTAIHLAYAKGKHDGKFEG